VEVVETQTAPARLAETAMVVGTAAYMSPEQALGESVDERSELFSFGVVLYEILTGRLLSTGRTSTAVIDAVLHQVPAPIPRFNDQAPDALVRVVERLLEKDRALRYQSAHEVWTELRRLKDDLASGRVSATGAGPHDGRRRRIGSRGPVRVVAALIGVAVVAAVAWRLWPTRHVTLWPTQAGRLVALPTKVPEPVEKLNGGTAAVARAYGVQLCLLSSITAQPGKLLLILQFADPSTRSMVWSQRYEDTPDTYLTLVREAADGVRAALRPAAAPVQAPAGQMTNAAALQCGQSFSNRYTNRHQPADLEQARAAIDANGNLWVALAATPGLYVYAPDGEKIRAVQLRAAGPLSAARAVLHRVADAGGVGVLRVRRATARGLKPPGLRRI
jgi:hypothetical protein